MLFQAKCFEELIDIYQNHLVYLIKP